MFKEGDLLTGTKNADIAYNITTSDATLKYIDNNPRGYNNMRVKVIDHKTKKCKIGTTWKVQSRYFRRLENSVEKIT